MGGPRGCYVKWNNPDRERQMPYDITQMWNLKNNIRKQNRNILIDAEHSDSCQMGEGLRGWVTKVIKDNISQWRPHCGHMAYIGHQGNLYLPSFKTNVFPPAPSCPLCRWEQSSGRLRVCHHQVRVSVGTVPLSVWEGACSPLLQACFSSLFLSLTTCLHPHSIKLIFSPTLLF